MLKEITCCALLLAFVFVPAQDFNHRRCGKRRAGERKPLRRHYTLNWPRPTRLLRHSANTPKISMGSRWNWSECQLEHS